jgi:hypothetical protein
MVTQAKAAPESMELFRMTAGLLIHQSLYAAAKLGIADFLKDGERSVSEIANALNANEDALYRVLRFLSANGVFERAGAETFANNVLSNYLRSDVPGSMRAFLIFRGSGYFFSPFSEFLYSVQTGKPGREKILGMDGFEYLRQNPEEARIFDEAMTATAANWAPVIAAAYDFGAWESLMDVGGGNGILLAEILRSFPGLRGVLADQAHVLERARERGFLAGELAERVSLEPCDFFQRIPAGCRAYLMKSVIHDWDDEHSVAILRKCRHVVPSDGALLLVEYCLADDGKPSLGKMIDVVMLAVTGGKERTLEQYRKLLSAGGFRLSRSVPVTSDLMIVEAIPA